MITIFHGTDRLTVEERIADARASMDPTGISTTIIDNASSDLSSVRSAAGAIGFFGTGRLVVARDLLSTGSKRGRKSKSDSSAESVVDILAGIPRETTLFVVELQLDPKTEREIRKVVPDVSIERYDVPRGRTLVEWTSERARRYDAIIGQEEARALLEALFPGNWATESRRDDVPPDLYRLDSEIAKLATAAGSGETIMAGHISALVPGADAQDFWGITNAIMDRDASRAVVELERAFSHGSAAEAILGQITSQFEALAVASTAERGMPLSQVAAVSGLSEGRLRQASRAATAFPVARIADALDALRQLDADTKQGLIDVTNALVPLVAALASGKIERSDFPIRQ